MGENNYGGINNNGDLNNYYDYAEDDFAFFMTSYNAGYTFNSMCVIAQNICEKYLKYLLDTYFKLEVKLDNEDILKAREEYKKKYKQEYFDKNMNIKEHSYDKNYNDDIDDGDRCLIMKAHSVKKLVNFIRDHAYFPCNYKAIILCDGYYNDSRYPGNGSFYVNDEDVQICHDSIIACKNAVDDFIQHQKELEIKKARRQKELEDKKKRQINLKKNVNNINNGGYNRNNNNNNNYTNYDYQNDEDENYRNNSNSSNNRRIKLNRR